MISKPVNFYPGPSKLDPNIGMYLSQGFEEGIYEVNHRSAVFGTLLANTRAALIDKLNIPADYEFVLTSSATECWEMIAQSVIGSQSLHLHNGAFGKKWFTYTKRLRNNTKEKAFGINEVINVDALAIDKRTDLIAITHNETSNGTRVPIDVIRAVKSKYPDCLVAVDVTSSLGGESIDLSVADIWYASVQKCLGLPPGLAVMILSPQAVNQVYALNERNHYNSLAFVLDNFRNNQTPYTPNIPAIHLLHAVMNARRPLAEIHAQTERRYDKLQSYVNALPSVSFLCAQENVRSRSVLAIEAAPAVIHALKTKAADLNILLGNGYGSWKDTSFRIANFPSLTDEEIDLLIDEVR